MQNRRVKLVNRAVSAVLSTVLLLGLSGMAQAQDGQVVQTAPTVAYSGDASSTIVSSVLFQQIWAGVSGSQRRKGCLVLNNSTGQQWVYFQGPGMTTPTAGNFTTIKAASIPLNVASATNAGGGWVQCVTQAGSALQDAVWIAGTAGDSYVAKQQ